VIKHENRKKFIVCSIVALLIGVSAVVPLVFLMSATAQPRTGPEPWFDIDMPYAYWETLNGPIIFPTMSNFTAGLNETNSVSQRHKIPLNITLVADTTAKQSVDAQLEYYEIEVNTDKEYLMTKFFMVGTNGNSDFDPTNLLDGFEFKRREWFNTDDFEIAHDGGSALLKEDWSSGTWSNFSVGGSGTRSVGENSTCHEVDVL